MTFCVAQVFYCRNVRAIHVRIGDAQFGFVQVCSKSPIKLRNTSECELGHAHNRAITTVHRAHISLSIFIYIPHLNNSV